MKIGDETLFKQLFTLEWSDFSEKLGTYFLEQLGETSTDVLEDLTTLLDGTTYKVYVGGVLKSQTEKFFSLVNTYNIITYGSIKTYVAESTEE